MAKGLVLQTCALLLTAATSVASAQTTRYEPFPPGYGYMDAKELKDMSDALNVGDHKVLRQHGWKLWAGIMQPSQTGWPRWFTWPNSHTAFVDQDRRSNAINKSQTVPLRQRSILNGGGQPGGVIVPVNTPQPSYPIPKAVRDAFKDSTERCGADNICDGPNFVFNGDIMIPTESLSQEAADWITDSKSPLNKKATLDDIHAKGGKIESPQRAIVTKHMYWPVKKTELAALPVWHHYFSNDYTGYAGYETWTEFIAIDPIGDQVGSVQKVTYLHGVFQSDGKTPLGPFTAEAKVHSINEFYHRQITNEDWDRFTEADKAILNAASYWAYDKPFGPGDYLVTVAMHVNTKELRTWTMQSVWWSDRMTDPASANRPNIPQAVGPWDHYLMVDSYGIPDIQRPGFVPLAANPYIEFVIHPIATDCNNCHIRAGWPKAPSFTDPNPNLASYQSKGCLEILAKLKPEDPCFKPLTLTDFFWIIPDRAQ